jgi:hypothetical protein
LNYIDNIKEIIKQNKEPIMDIKQSLDIKEKQMKDLLPDLTFKSITDFEALKEDVRDYLHEYMNETPITSKYAESDPEKIRRRLYEVNIGGVQYGAAEIIVSLEEEEPRARLTLCTKWAHSIERTRTKQLLPTSKPRNMFCSTELYDSRLVLHQIVKIQPGFPKLGDMKYVYDMNNEIDVERLHGHNAYATKYKARIETLIKHSSKGYKNYSQIKVRPKVEKVINKYQSDWDDVRFTVGSEEGKSYTHFQNWTMKDKLFNIYTTSSIEKPHLKKAGHARVSIVDIKNTKLFESIKTYSQKEVEALKSKLLKSEDNDIVRQLVSDLFRVLKLKMNIYNVAQLQDVTATYIELKTNISAKTLDGVMDNIDNIYRFVAETLEMKEA